MPSNIKLTSLAHVIVLAMGWEESHLSMFKKWKKEYHVYMDGADMYAQIAKRHGNITHGLVASGMRSSSLLLIRPLL